MKFKKESLLMIFMLTISGNCSIININGTTPKSRCIQHSLIDLYCNFIPTDIPHGIKRIHFLRLNSNLYIPSTLTKGLFATTNWNKIEYLEFQFDLTSPLAKFDSHGLSTLQNLQELHVHSDWLVTLDPDAFVGLHKLEVLDLSNCPRLSIGNLLQALNGSNKLPNLRNLSIVWMNSYHGGIEINSEMYDILKAKPLKSLDISDCDVRSIDLQGLQKLTMLEYLNAKGIKVSNFEPVLDITLDHLKLLNLSYITVPDQIIGTISHIRSLSDIHVKVNGDNFKALTKTETLDISNIIPSDIPFQQHNVTLFAQTTLNWTIKNLKLRNNNLQYIDLRLILSGCSHLESIDFSQNQMQFLYPDILKQCKNLKNIDLSYNSLNQMATNNYSSFKNLTKSYFNLTSISLASNQLEYLPEDFFVSNKFLETIELSNNKLKQVEFRLEHMPNLKRLDLSYNDISILSKKSIQRLQAITASRTNSSTLPNVLDLRNNQFSCDQCETIQSVQWIMETILVDVQKQQLMCKDENGQSTRISKEVLIKLEEMCERPNRVRRTVLLSTFIPLIMIALISVTVFLLKKYKRQQKYEKVMNEKVRLIQKDKADTKYVVFVSHSSADEIFVQRFVYPELKRHLGRITKTDRELVCIGDKHFRLGKMICNEMVHCLKQSAVMLIIVSKNYCHSVYCRNEFSQAQLLEKPIILMFKEEVEKCEMPVLMREVFTKYSRVLWEYQDGQPVLKTSWENVCTSILELVD